MIETIGVVVMLVVVFAFSLWTTALVARHLRNSRALWMEELEERGPTYVSDLPFLGALIIFWLASALAAITMMPAIVWIAVQDAEAGAAAARMAIVVVVIWGLAWLLARPSYRAWILEPAGITRATRRRSRHIPYDRIVELRESRVWPMLVLRSHDARMRVSKAPQGYDDLFNRLVESCPHARHAEASTGDDDTGPAFGPIDQPARYALNRTRLRAIGGLIIALFLFLVGWPWFVLDPDIRIPDAIWFDLIGLVMWAAFAGLLAKETFQRSQPAEIELADENISWRVLRGTTERRAAHELVSATVETDIIYVKGMPGYRYPLHVRFTDGTGFHVDDFRARHLGAGTHLIGADIRRRLLDPESRTDELRRRAVDARHHGDAAAASGEIDAAVSHWHTAIACHPTPDHLELHARAAELLAGTDRHEEAVRERWSHVDHFPRDATSWQSLAESLRAISRDDLARDATAAAERLLLSGERAA